VILFFERKEPMSKVYVSSFDLLAARHVRDVLRANGHEVVSTWHEPGAPRPATDTEWPQIIANNASQIQSADALVLTSTKADVPGGKFVEAGIAIGADKRIVVIGHRENRLLWHPSVVVVATPEEAAAAC